MNHRLIAAFIVGLASATAVAAYAQDPIPDPATPPELMCRIFPTDLSASDGDTFRTADGTEAVGQWVNAQAAQGWQIASTDFETGQKSTGYPTAWTQVCLRR